MQCQWCEFFSGTCLCHYSAFIIIAINILLKVDFRIVLLVKAICSIIMKHTKNIWNTKKKLMDNTWTAILLSGELIPSWFMHSSYIKQNNGNSYRNNSDRTAFVLLIIKWLVHLKSQPVCHMSKCSKHEWFAGVLVRMPWVKF